MKPVVVVYAMGMLCITATGASLDPSKEPDLRSCESRDGPSSFNAACDTENDPEEPRPMCHPGQKRIGCSKNTSCQACKEGHFQPFFNSCTDECRVCAVCGPHQEIEQACTDESDTVCRDRETPVSAPDTTHTGSNTPPSTGQTGGSTPSDTSQPGVNTPISEHPLTTPGSSAGVGPSKHPFQTENGGRNQSNETPNSGPSTQQTDKGVVIGLSVALAVMTLVAVIAICCCVKYRRQYKDLRRERDVESQGIAASNGNRGQGSRQDGDDEHAAETDGLMQDSQAVPAPDSCAGPSQHGTHGGRGHVPASPTLSQEGAAGPSIHSGEGPKKKNPVCRTVDKLVGKHKRKGKGETKPPRYTEPESLGLLRRGPSSAGRGNENNVYHTSPLKSTPTETNGDSPLVNPVVALPLSLARPDPPLSDPPLSDPPPYEESGERIHPSISLNTQDCLPERRCLPETTCTEKFLLEVTNVVSLAVVTRLCIHLELKQKDIDNVKDAPDRGDAESQGYKMLRMVLSQRGKEITYNRILNALKDIGETNGADQLVEKFNIRLE